MTDFPDMSARRAVLVKAFERHIRRTSDWPADVDFFPPEEFTVTYDDEDLLHLRNVDEGYGTHLIGRFHPHWILPVELHLDSAVFIGDDDDEFRIIPQEDINP